VDPKGEIIISGARVPSDERGDFLIWGECCEDPSSATTEEADQIICGGSHG
jgi:hypothetical protein